VKSVFRLFFIPAFLFLALFARSYAQDNVPNGSSPPSNEKQTGFEGMGLDSRSQSDISWEHRDLLRSGTAEERADGQNRVRTYSLYPQSFSAVKPEARQDTPARSYFLSYDRDKENALVGMANVGTADKIELKKLYQNNVDTELLVGYQWANFGSILFGRAVQLDREGDTSFGHIYDMGWRLKFLKTF